MLAKGTTMANQTPTFQAIKRHWLADKRARETAARMLRALELDIPPFPSFQLAPEDTQRERLATAVH